MKLIQMQLPKNVHIGGLQTSLLESDKFEMLAYMDAGLVQVTVKRTGQEHIITFAGLMMTPDPVAKREAVEPQAYTEEMSKMTGRIRGKSIHSGPERS